MKTQPADNNELEQLKDRLRAAADAFPTDANFTDRVLASIARDSIRPQSKHSLQYRRWFMRTSLATAAGFGVAVCAWFLATPSQPVYAITDLPQRMLALNSIHLKGEIFPRNGTPSQPIELYAKQPDLCRVNGHMDEVNGKPVAYDIVYAKDQVTTIDPTAKTFTVEPENEADLRVQVAQALDGEMQAMFGPANADKDFRKIRHEKIAGADVDVYELMLPQGEKLDLWFNPSTGLPVRSELCETEPGKADHLQVRFNTIEANPSIEDTVFHPPVPAGYAVVHTASPTGKGASDPSSQPYRGETAGGGTFGNVHVQIRYPIALDNGAVLLCWYMYDDRHPTEDLKLPDGQTSLTITSPSGITFTEHLLHADAIAWGWHWRWSLLQPAKATQEKFLTIKAERGGSSFTDTLVPITYSPDRLAKEIELLQRQTLPKGTAPMTLDEIKQAVAGDK